MIFNGLKSLYYRLEKGVAGSKIPAVYEIPNRKKLSDYNALGDKKSGDGEFDHSFWDKVLRKHVFPGQVVGPIRDVSTVDYASLSSDPDFAAYLSELEKAPDVESTLNPPQQLAFWMNAYNALCINLIITNENYAGKDGRLIKSINDLSSNGKECWDMTAGIIAGKEMTLNQIEHEQLRMKWDEPSLHGCIVCASASCPNLRAEAFVANRLREQMDDQMKNWMRNHDKGLKLSDDQKRLEMSRIFLWFEDDFGGWDGMKKWIPQFIENEQLRSRVVSGDVTRNFFEYSWQINRFAKDARSTETN